MSRTLRGVSSWLPQLTQSPRPLVSSGRRSVSSTSEPSKPPSSSSTPSTSSASAPTTSSTPTPTLRSDLSHPSLRYLQSLTPSSLAHYDPLLDLHPSLFLSPSSTGPHKVHTVHLETQPSQPRPEESKILAPSDGEDNLSHLSSLTGLSVSEIRGLHRYPLVIKRVVSMKSKGKMPSMYALVVVGNGEGMVGVGEGNDATAKRATGKAFAQAVRSMDYVKRREERTVWGTLGSNFGSTKIEMRERQPGFGLRVNNYIHQVAKAAGISDLSAKVIGSRNPTRVIKLAVQMLQGGSVPLDMGEFGHKGARKNKKKPGMQTAEEIGKARGRAAIAL